VGEPSTDAEAVAASLDDPSRFALLFDRHYAPLRRYLVQRIGEDVANDLAAQVFVTAFEVRTRYDLSRPDARPWLFGIATNLLRHHVRDERARLEAYARRAAEDARLPEDRPDLESRLDARAALPRLIDALSSLPQGDRDSLLLFAWADLSYAEIALALSIPVGTVRSRLNRARRTMRELLPHDLAMHGDTERG
jgi:RNA polymerase sigma-70 factor (ECF subfamily)